MSYRDRQRMRLYNVRVLFNLSTNSHELNNFVYIETKYVKFHSNSKQTLYNLTSINQVYSHTIGYLVVAEMFHRSG